MICPGQPESTLSAMGIAFSLMHGHGPATLETVAGCGLPWRTAQGPAATLPCLLPRVRCDLLRCNESLPQPCLAPRPSRVL